MRPLVLAIVLVTVGCGPSIAGLGATIDFSVVVPYPAVTDGTIAVRFWRGQDDPKEDSLLPYGVEMTLNGDPVTLVMTGNDDGDWYPAHPYHFWILHRFAGPAPSAADEHDPFTFVIRNHGEVYWQHTFDGRITRPAPDDDWPPLELPVDAAGVATLHLSAPLDAEAHEHVYLDCFKGVDPANPFLAVDPSEVDGKTLRFDLTGKCDDNVGAYLNIERGIAEPLPAPFAGGTLKTGGKILRQVSFIR
jgi:hypothetical protein